MKFTIPLAALLISCFAASVLGQAKLEGQVFNDKGKPVSNVRVIVPGGQPATTDSKGHFFIGFPASVTPGIAVRIRVANWTITHPMFGECWTQSVAISRESLKITIVSPSSAASTVDPKRLGAIVNEFQARVKRQAKTISSLSSKLNKLEREREKSAFLREYQEEYGFPADKLKRILDQWAQMKESGDALERAQKEYWDGNFEKVTEITGTAGPVALEILKSRHKENLEAGRKVVGMYTVQGNAFYEQFKFREAMASFEVIDQLFKARDLPKEDLIGEWAEIKDRLGTAKRELGSTVEGPEGQRLLAESAEEFRQALTVYTPAQTPGTWARTQSNLIGTLRSQGERMAGAEGMRLLTQAEEALQQVLTVTHDQLPRHWAYAQNELGLILSTQAERLERAEGNLPRRSVEDFLQRQAVTTSERLPMQAGGARNKPGSEAERLKIAEALKLLRQSAEAHRQAQTVMTRERWPVQWATSQNNLGIALTLISQRLEGTEGVEVLRQALEAFRSALGEHTRERLPVQWAMIQNNIGIVLSLQAEGAAGDGTMRLRGQAAETYRLALQVRTRQQFPQDWARTKYNLGLVLSRRGAGLTGEERIRVVSQAVEAFRDALEVQTLDHLPFDWGRSHANLAIAYRLIGNWPRAAESFSNVLLIYPDNEEAYFGLSVLYHDRLFEFEKAYALNQQWLARRPDDLFPQATFAEKHFTTGRFAECEQQIKVLINKREVLASIKISLRATEIANLLALSQSDQVPIRIDKLIEVVSRQRSDFQIQWGFDGTRHFIGREEKLSPHRAWLGQLFDALASKDRDAMLKALQEVRANFNG